MEDCQTPQIINDNRLNSLCVDTGTIHHEVGADENAAIEKESENSQNGDSIGLTDNFYVNLLSRDSPTDPTISKEKVTLKSVGNNVFETGVAEESNARKEKDCEIYTVEDKQGNDVLISNPAISDNKLEAVIKEKNFVTCETEVETNKTVGDSSSENVNTEREASNVTEENMEIIKGNQNHVSMSANSLSEKCNVEVIKEVVIKDTPKSCVEKEKPSENVSHPFCQSGYRCEADMWTDDEDSSTSDSSSDSDFFQEMCEKAKPKKLPFVKTKGELSLDDLPPIEDLVLSVNESEMTAIGKIYAVVEKLVVIRSTKGMKALDLDSVLFLSHDQPLGRVFDVFGPVNEPFYSVRFNSVDQINEKGVKVGADVFFAPEKTDMTTYVFLENLQNQKGSDASWKHNNEPPEEFLDYSDDEKEKTAKRQRRFKNRSRQFTNSSDVPAKRPLLADDSSNYIPPPKPAPQWNHSQNTSHRISRPNPFQTHFTPTASRSSSVCSIMSPVRMQNSFGSSPNHPQRLAQPQNILFGSSPQFLVSPYQQPHVFGQVTLLNHLSPALHASSPMASPVMNGIPALIPASPFSAPQNYFNQTFSRSPSPATHNQRMPPEPWVRHRPLHSSVPPSHPLTVQIPNVNPLREFNRERAAALRPFVNIHNANFNEPFGNNNRNFPTASMQPRFYHN